VSSRADGASSFRELGKATQRREVVPVRVITAEGRPATTRGVLYVHSCPRAVVPHVESAVATVFGVRPELIWRDQPVLPGSLRTDVGWSGPAGSAAQLISKMKGWPELRVEVVEEPRADLPGERFVMTPDLGIHRVPVDALGEGLIVESRLRMLVEKAGHDLAALRDGINALIGADWEDELEAFRWAGEGADIRWVHRTG